MISAQEEINTSKQNSSERTYIRSAEFETPHPAVKETSSPSALGAVNESTPQRETKDHLLTGLTHFLTGPVSPRRISLRDLRLEQGAGRRRRRIAL